VSNQSGNTRCTKKKFTRRMKKLIFCGAIQNESISPPLKSTLPKELKTNCKFFSSFF
jgi:hypothetical protein